MELKNEAMIWRNSHKKMIISRVRQNQSDPFIILQRLLFDAS